jgi:pimeloyl-ACP methyl ester carboxylesterase
MTQTGEQPTTGYAPANGVGIYWESHGSGGTPLVLLHGGYGLASMFDPLIGKPIPTARSAGTASATTSPR